MSGEPCRGVPVDGSTDLDGNPKNNPGIKCDCSYNNGTVCHIIQLYVAPKPLTSVSESR
jgi:hypothetical protein